jgi:hypothetical protein
MDCRSAPIPGRRGGRCRKKKAPFLNRNGALLVEMAGIDAFVPGFRHGTDRGEQRGAVGRQPRRPAESQLLRGRVEGSRLDSGGWIFRSRFIQSSKHIEKIDPHPVRADQYTTLHRDRSCRIGGPRTQQQRRKNQLRRDQALSIGSADPSIPGPRRVVEEGPFVSMEIWKILLKTRCFYSHPKQKKPTYRIYSLWQIPPSRSPSLSGNI